MRARSTMRLRAAGAEVGGVDPGLPMFGGAEAWERS